VSAPRTMDGKADAHGASRARRRAVSVIAVLAVASLPRAAHAEPALEAGQHFQVDPVSDGVLTGASVGFSTLLGLILSTGEIQPTPISPGAENQLLGIDRIAVTQQVDPHAVLYSDLGLGVAVAYAVLDPVLSGVRDGWDALIVDAVLYGESAALTQALTDITKIAVRRPRPIDYIHCASSASSAGCSSTNMELSFFSGHTAGVSSVVGTATYLAFVRAPHTARPWITLGAGALLTAFVGYERVRAAAHFPTDVITGALAGASVGVLVPHLHRHKEEAPPVWLGLAPVTRGQGGSVTLQGFF
jgi:membrane-associated phospholipid phosphatase